MFLNGLSPSEGVNKRTTAVIPSKEGIPKRLMPWDSRSPLEAAPGAGGGGTSLTGMIEEGEGAGSPFINTIRMGDEAG